MSRMLPGADKASPAGAEIVALGLVSPAGNAAEDLLAAARRGGRAPEKLVFEDSSSREEDVFGYQCSFPEAADHLKPGRLRRLGRLLTMSLLAAKKAVSELGREELSRSDTATCIGTGLGSLGDTAAFLENMIRLEGRFPKPAHFVNSVHNAAASQVAIELGLRGENLTLTHREISFEAALWQAVRSLRNGRSRYAVVGGVDELNRFQLIAGRSKQLWKDRCEPLAPLSRSPSPSRGTLPGEGAVICILRSPGERTPDGGSGGYGRLQAVRFGRFHRDARTYLDLGRTADFIEETLSRAGVRTADVDLFLSGANGDRRLDGVYRRVGDELSRRAGGPIAHGTFKQLCGDYHSAGAFGFAVAALALRSASAPPGLFCGPGSAPTLDRPVKTVLLYGLSRFGTHGVCVLQR